MRMEAIHSERAETSEREEGKVEEIMIPRI